MADASAHLELEGDFTRTTTLVIGILECLREGRENDAVALRPVEPLPARVTPDAPVTTRGGAPLAGPAVGVAVAVLLAAVVLRGIGDTVAWLVVAVLAAAAVGLGAPSRSVGRSCAAWNPACARPPSGSTCRRPSRRSTSPGGSTTRSRTAWPAPNTSCASARR